jgi:hypothetical protein
MLAVLSKLRPMLEVKSDEAEQFRAEIGLLHERLENYELHTGKGSGKSRISFREVFLKEISPAPKIRTHYGYELRVERSGNQIKIEIKRIKSSAVLFLYTQSAFDLSNLESQSGFQQKLTPKLQASLRQLYLEAAPKWVENLTTYKDPDVNNREIKCGAFSFLCGKDALFAGVVEVLYQMRNTLFHGELVPTRGAVLCYEPAYRLVRRFLESVS